ncbi:MAG TPA: glycine cleavage system aminomethyltransferase GcvT [Anaerolineae bacterium]|nr:glycine cleavage system aminomethyltransferase GcvT [Anaerolineae bacterium]HID85022.1 glycine cleavage system aminomethyltransferase GcvT [Anaerolineales bacterium]
MTQDYLFRGTLRDLDPALYELTQIEAERQVRRLILIPSESQAPLAVREAMASAFQNIYAEGYPPEHWRWLSEEEILDYKARLAEYRRLADPRYYKGVEYADIVESLARRRCAEAFAANGVSADDLFVNVQPLSGAPANNAVYHALIKPGDTILSMHLVHGGHLSHGSPANRSGKLYQVVHYTVHPETERLDYDQVEALALEHKPQIIVAGYSSYPWAVDWARFRAIADQVGAYLMADIAHVAGLVVGGAYPSPVGYADVITFTTHKTLGGPRGAVILTTDPVIARKIDRAVFPGEQGGPHVNIFAALALLFKLAQTELFRQYAHQVVKNCIAFTERLRERGFRIPYGGTDTHLMNLDCKSVRASDGTPLSGDLAARILDVAGIVVNRNTIPGDKGARNPSGIRMGTPWITQRGFDEARSRELADVIADLLWAVTPYTVDGKQRAKVDYDALQDARLRVRDLADRAGRDVEPQGFGYPHFIYPDDQPQRPGDRTVLEIGGERVRQFLNFALASDVEGLEPGQTQPTRLHTPKGWVSGTLRCVEPRRFRLTVPREQTSLVMTYLRDLSDGYIAFDDLDLKRKVPGPAWVLEALDGEPDPLPQGEVPEPQDKPYFVGLAASRGSGSSGTPEGLPEFQWEEAEPEGLRRTPLFDLHKRLGAKMVRFAGWEMPVWYSSVLEEHLAVRQAAGLFDVTHMGVYQVEGPDAAAFLDSVCGNDIGKLKVGEAAYAHFLDPDAKVIDDLYVYRRDTDKYLVVVNAANDEKDWAWLNAVKEGRVLVDRARPGARAFGRGAELRNLRDPEEGADMRVDLALQGPRSREVLLALGADPATRRRILRLKRNQLAEVTLGGFDLIVSRTGYTGEKMGFELFVHPDRAAELFEALLRVGEPLGLKPCGLGARDSLRTEAGLPLYGHELGGLLNLGVGEAGFARFVKTYKPWFIGREAFLAREAQRQQGIVRFRFTEKHVRMAHLGDPVLDKRGKVVGAVTSCAIDSEGYLTGQAVVLRKYAEEGTPIFILQGTERLKKAPKAPAELDWGDTLPLPSAAVVVSRFLKKK